MAYATSATIINDAAKELGLVSSDVTDPYGSADASILQLCALLKRLGRNLVGRRAWTHLLKTHTFVTASGTTTYALPADYHRLVDQTAYNRTGQSPLAGPLTSQLWQAVAGSGTGFALTLLFRPWQSLFQVNPGGTVPDAQTLAYEYVSSYWVQPFGETAPTADAPTTYTDTLWMPATLLVTGLKLLWKREKGFDTTSAQADFDEEYALAENADASAPKLSLSGGSDDVQLVSESNLPQTGYGG